MLTSLTAAPSPADEANIAIGQRVAFCMFGFQQGPKLAVPSAK